MFETMSGATATGSTVIVGLDTAPRGLLMWRFLIVWFGGFGFVTLAVLVLPFLRMVACSCSFSTCRRSGEILVPRMIDVVMKVGAVYLLLTILGGDRLSGRRHVDL